MAIQRIQRPPPIPPRPADGHKGLFGRVLVVGGSATMLGAPVLAGTAALRMGAGLVQIAVPQAMLPAALSITPELIGLALSAKTGRDSQLLQAAEKSDAVVLGPGMGDSPAAGVRIDALISLPIPMVVDADALNHLARGKRWPKDFAAQAVLTPHPGEMKRLIKLIGLDNVPDDDAGRINIAVAAAVAFGQVLVLKGHRTVVTDGRRVYVNYTGDSTLSKAGAGDVLCGVLAALLALKMDRFDAACAAVHIHGLAGEIAGKRFGRRGALARNVIDALPLAISKGVKV